VGVDHPSFEDMLPLAYLRLIYGQCSRLGLHDGQSHLSDCAHARGKEDMFVSPVYIQQKFLNLSLGMMFEDDFATNILGHIIVSFVDESHMSLLEIL
jgi:hypothetical protein